MNKNNTYGIEIIDYRETITEDKPAKQINLDGWTTAEEAANAGWVLLEVVAAFDSHLNYENQGDQFMAYYTEGVTDKNGEPLEGMGAVIIKITNPDGTYYEDL